MRFSLKNTQTLIGSWTSIIFLFIYPNITQSQEVFAIYDPLSVSNNKFGIHIIQATPDESSPAAALVNTNGDWGYITFLIESGDRNQNKWQEFFNDLRKRHLIPIVRLATKPLNEHWEKPDEKEAEAWADFLDSLNWPIKNRYVVIYNEPNHGKEWGNFVDPENYAKVLDQTITALKGKNRNFFVLNAGFDASAPSKPPLFEDQVIFMRQMEEIVPGIFNKLDGWVSHSYPNPGFVGSPYTVGRGSVRTWIWELQVLRSLGVTKNLPVFITETGWKHSEGIKTNINFPSPETVADYFKIAFTSAWSSPRVVAVTPFLLSYQEPPFDHFSFKENHFSSEYHPHYHALRTLSKTSGRPEQEKKAQHIGGEIYSTLVSGEEYNIPLRFKNTGQSIWNDNEQVSLVPIEGRTQLGMEIVPISTGIKVEPGQEYTFNLKLKAPDSGSFKVVLNLYNGQVPFDSDPLEFTTEVQSSVVLQIKNSLKWKNTPEGEYLIRIQGAVGESVQRIYIREDGSSDKIEARFLLPEYSFEFTLEKPYYEAVTLRQKVISGGNVLDFGELSPNLVSAILNPKELWKLLPFSN